MNTVAEQHADSVGAILRQSREAKGLTTAQVAKQLNLKVSVIEQIEAEQWDPAVSITFMRGYLRAYARLMKLSEREILQAFELQAAYLRSQPRPMHSFSKKTSLDAAENRFMLATYLLIVLLIGLFLIWFWQTHLLDDTPVSVVPAYQVPVQTSSDSKLTPQPAGQTASSTVEAAPTLMAQTHSTTGQATTPVTDSQPVAVSQDNTTVTTVVAGTTEPQTSTGSAAELNSTSAIAATVSTAPALTDNAASTDRAAPIDANPATPQQQTAQPQNLQPATTGGETTASTEPMPSVATALPEATTATTGTTATAGAASLQLEFSADCWLEVYDQNNQRLAYGTQAAGKQLVLQGQLPFRLKLGNPPAASMKLNDVVVDLSGYPAGRVARITLTGQL
jgi:cytoskeleton protein RodZ